jgi:Transposase and inactivated derivatives
VVKYRRKVFLDDKIINELKTRTRKISEGFGIEVISQETDKDHTHILFKATPQTNLILEFQRSENMTPASRLMFVLPINF